MKKKQTIIELRGVEFVNKGAELMLHAIIDYVRKQWPYVIFVMEHTNRAPRKKHIENGLYTKTNIKKYRVKWEPVLNLMPFILRKKLFFIKEKEIDIVLDASGFAFGDFWGAKKARFRLANWIEKWKQNGKKIVLLPQALGPFSSSELQKEMRIIIENSDLIFARDDYSFKYIQELNPNSKNIFLSPDFTNLLKGKVPKYFQNNGKKVAIIPNTKIIESKSIGREKYMDILFKMVNIIINRNMTPFFLIHEGKNDNALVQGLLEEKKINLEVINEDDPIYIKGIIRNSTAVVTSRFHGLISALSQGVPCLSLGWSHKYKAVLDEYNYSKGLINVDSFEKQLEFILQEENLIEVRKHLLIEAEKQKERTKKMWEKVFTLFDNSDFDKNEQG